MIVMVNVSRIPWPGFLVSTLPVLYSWFRCSCSEFCCWSIVAVHSRSLGNIFASFVVRVTRARTMSVGCPICGARFGCLNMSLVHDW